MAARARRRPEPGKRRPAARAAGRAARPSISRRGSSPIERLRAICLALPETTEKVAWGEPTFRVRDKLFAQLDDHHHGADHLGVWLAAALGVQEMLVYADPARYFVPPYVGKRGWVGVRLDGKVDWSAVTRLVRDAYRSGRAPKRLATALQ